MSKWDYMDNKVWESSEVMKELESIFKKEAQDKAQQIKQVADANRDLAASIRDVAKAQSDTNKATAAADDNAVDEDKAKDKITDDDHKTAKESLLKELHSLANLAADSLNHKLSYKIERAIDSILYDEE